MSGTVVHLDERERRPVHRVDPTASLRHVLRAPGRPLLRVDSASALAVAVDAGLSDSGAVTGERPIVLLSYRLDLVLAAIAAGWSSAPIIASDGDLVRWRLSRDRLDGVVVAHPRLLVEASRDGERYGDVVWRWEAPETTRGKAGGEEREPVYSPG